MAQIVPTTNHNGNIAGKPPPILDIMESIPKTSMSFGMELYNNGTETGKQFKMGEHPSYGTLASARGMAKLAAAMADRGQASIITGTAGVSHNIQRVPLSWVEMSALVLSAC